MISHPGHVWFFGFFNLSHFALIKDHSARSLRGWIVLKSLQFIVRILQTVILVIAGFL